MQHPISTRCRPLAAKAASVGLAVLLALASCWIAAAGPSGAAESPPVAVDDEYSMPMNTELVVPVALGILANDTNLPVGADYTRLFDANHNAANSFSPNGAFSYTPDAGFVGDDSYTYCITEQFGGGTCLSNIATILIHVLGPPPVPVAVDNVYYLAGGQALNATSILENDNDVPSGASYKLLTTATHVAVSNFQADGSFNYFPVAGYIGDDSYTYCVTAVYGNGECLSNAATLLIHVQAPPPPAVADDDSYSTTSSATLTIAAPGILANDANLPDSGGIRTFTAFAHSADFDINVDGSLAYTPIAGFVGVDTATYCVTEGIESSSCVTDVATITVTVTAPAPVLPQPVTQEPTTAAAPAASVPSNLSVVAAPASATLALTGGRTEALAAIGVSLALCGVMALVLARPRHRI